MQLIGSHGSFGMCVHAYMMVLFQKSFIKYILQLKSAALVTCTDVIAETALEVFINDWSLAGGKLG